MDDINKKLIWLVIIFPGFLSVTIIGSIVDIGDAGEFNLTFYALALTFVDAIFCFLILGVVVGLLRLLGISLREPSKIALFITAMLAVSVIVGLLMGIAAERGSFYSLVRQIPFVDVLNKRSQARPLIFLLRKNSGGDLNVPGDVGDGRPAGKVGEAYLRVYLDNDVIYEGWPEFYDAKPTELYLSPACTVTEHKGENATAVKVPGPGAFIPESEMKRAILVDRDSSPCWHLYFAGAAQDRPAATPVPKQ